ncbi:CDP-glycerol glycerophosphotransferase family protein [Microbacterium elymi]|uniref:CDP-glycerol glycerophosphotransferase family protein n=1 Tax=Microbacterium elymi TaxID=2909587 RepID=A0ABY5NKQ8_9MICO|nr:CDP-glycerol glycerophosphotransferase family protein [Microbacterium elymi]UUT35738.1 CDP-glycerol glycerophosphotransferase family protein [Microbacterium elymi]
MLAQLYHVATSRALVIDTYAMVASLLRHGPGLTVVQIWHALGAFKKFGLSILDHEEGRDRRLAQAMRMHQGYDVVLASGPECRPAFADAFGTSIDNVTVAPLPGSIGCSTRSAPTPPVPASTTFIRTCALPAWRSSRRPSGSTAQ